MDLYTTVTVSLVITSLIGGYFNISNSVEADAS